jgi:hypothetical protein
MAKGMFMQGVAVLFRAPPTPESIAACLAGEPDLRAAPAAENWEFSGPNWTTTYRRELNGVIQVDVVSQPWPDSMGDPKQSPTLFGAWSMGFFGPLTFPGSLARAIEQPWTCAPAGPLASQHRAFARVRLSYVFGAGENAPVLPEGANARDELEAVVRIARRLLEHPDALVYFNPNGEIVADRATIDDASQHNRAHDLPSLDLWSNVRMFDTGDGFTLMDTVGMEQLFVGDCEAVFERKRASPEQVASMLRNVSLYLLQRGPMIRDGHTTDGPGGQWRARESKESMASPPRPVLRFRLDGAPEPVK